MESLNGFITASDTSTLFDQTRTEFCKRTLLNEKTNWGSLQQVMDEV